MIRICARELKGSTSRRNLVSKIRVRCFSRIPAPTWSVEELNLNSSKNSSINVIQDDELNLLSQRCLIDLDQFSDEERQDLKNELGKMMKCISLVCETDTKFQELAKSATFGNYPSDSLPGSMLSKDLFNNIGDFIHGARSGEDEEWLGRVQNSQYSIGRIDHAKLSYYGLPKSAADLAKKWFFYSIKSAPINVAQSQKGAYFFLMFLFLIYFFFNWNYIFTNDQWDKSPYFIPHINKIVWSIFFFMYLWSKLSENTKNRVLMLIFGLFLISIFVLLFLLMN